MSPDLRGLIERAQRWSWLAGRTTLLAAAVLVMIGGVMASITDRALSDVVVVASFFLLLPGLVLAWLGLPAARQLPDPEELPS